MSEITIPPESILGPIEARIDVIVARVIELTHATGGDEWVELAVRSAIVWVVDQTNRNDVGLPDDEPTVLGLVGMSTRMFLDAHSPNGAQVAIGDPGFEPLFQPDRLDKHWRDYWRRLYQGWGIA